MLRVGVGLAASLLLTACEGGLPGFDTIREAAGGGSGSKAVGQREATVTSGKVRLRGPDGFCVDPRSTTASAEQAFVVFGNCAAITGNANEAQPYLSAIATATVTSGGLTGEAAVTPRLARLNAFFRSAQGRAALSRSGDAASVTIGESFAEDGALFLRVRDTSPVAFKGAQLSYWRSYFDAGSSVVAMSVIGMAGSPVTSAQGLDALRDFVDRNRRDPASSITVKVARPGRGGLLDRLFP